MENRNLLLFFFILYSITITLIFLSVVFELYSKNKELEKYNEELNFELAKLRRK